MWETRSSGNHLQVALAGTWARPRPPLLWEPNRHWFLVKRKLKPPHLKIESDEPWVETRSLEIFALWKAPFGGNSSFSQQEWGGVWRGALRMLCCAWHRTARRLNPDSSATSPIRPDVFSDCCLLTSLGAYHPWRRWTFIIIFFFLYIPDFPNQEAKLLSASIRAHITLDTELFGLLAV